MTTQALIDIEVLRAEIRTTYTEVASEPDRAFIVPAGRAMGLANVDLLEALIEAVPAVVARQLRRVPRGAA